MSSSDPEEPEPERPGMDCIKIGLPGKLILSKRKGPILLKIDSENRFSGKTYFHTIASSSSSWRLYTAWPRSTDPQCSRPRFPRSCSRRSWDCYRLAKEHFMNPIYRQSGDSWLKSPKFQAPDQDVRLLVLQTFQILVDRHSNREKLVELTLEPTNLDLEGYPNKFNRSDQGGNSKEKHWLKFWLEKWLEIPFWFCEISELPIFELLISLRNLKPKIKLFFKPKLKPTNFLLNRSPDVRAEEPLQHLQPLQARGRGAGTNCIK